MASTNSADNVGVERGESTSSGGVGRIVDWTVSAFLALWGIAFLLGGYSLFQLADRTRITRWVADGTITSTELTDPQLIDTTYAMAWWGGIGIAVTGVLLVVAAVGLLTARSRARRQYDATGAAHQGLWTSALLGAVVTFVTSFVPFSPVIGGGVAGYVRRGSREVGARTGAISGLVATVPLVVVFAFVGIGILTTGGAMTGFVGAVFLLSLLVSAAYFVVLGGLGGYLGVILGERNDRTI